MKGAAAQKDPHPLLPARVLARQVFDRLRQRASDPYTISVLFMMALVAGGVTAIALAWRGAAATANVAIQLAFVVSGAAGGLALVGVGIDLLHVQYGRRIAARERLEMNEVLLQAKRLGEQLAAGSGRQGESVTRAVSSVES